MFIYIEKYNKSCYNLDYEVGVYYEKNKSAYFYPDVVYDWGKICVCSV